MKRLFHLLVIMVSCATVSEAATTAKQLLDAAAEKLSDNRTVTADFVITANGENEYGNIIIAGEKFAITAGSLSTWYDGKTQWTYSKATNEVNVSQPTPEELQQINPFAIINAFRNQYNYRLTEAVAGNPTVELTPKSPADNISKVTISFNAATGYPAGINLRTDNGDITISVSGAKEIATLPASTFTFNKNNYPGVEIIDLR